PVARLTAVAVSRASARLRTASPPVDASAAQAIATSPMATSASATALPRAGADGERAVVGGAERTEADAQARGKRREDDAGGQRPRFEQGAPRVADVA